MSGLIALIAGIALIIYAVQHDKKSKDDSKWLKDWGFWVITVIILVIGILNIGDSSPSGIFGTVMFLALLGLLYWRITDRSKKGLHGKPRVLHTIVTILFVVIWLLVLGPVENALNPSSTDSEAKQSESSSTDNDKYVRLDGHKIYYTASKKYSISGSEDTSWPAATADINNVTVYKIESGYTYGSKRGGKKVQGMVAINVKVKALKDIDVNMDSATVSIPSIDEQHDIETKEDWDDQDKGISKSGTLYVPIYKMHSINSIKSLRLKFDCNQQDTDDFDNYDHTYDMTIDLSK
ncbi:hypothetical protein EFS28_08140 [Lactobacillus acidophilus]|uniref:hypothetical protein n=1 Tax=Lactobacillus acidophilus TaxID=1579 RepID=UPI0021A33397|nr:hypothetical protein [Lactobacillus acidophilus]MCT3603192.1 hypothetical protein [Lactobacillus acidophilus]MCT3624175.1 hypothetical protein [Lactobacillus acidophilus]